MEYILLEWLHDLEDEPCKTYLELDRERHVIRKVELYRSGVYLPYDQDSVKSAPLPRDLRQLDAAGEFLVHTLTYLQFQEAWEQAQELPGGLMGLFF